MARVRAKVRDLGRAQTGLGSGLGVAAFGVGVDLSRVAASPDAVMVLRALWRGHRPDRLRRRVTSREVTGEAVERAAQACRVMAAGARWHRN